MTQKYSLLAKVWVFIARLVQHCSAKAEATGSNPVEAPKFLFGIISQLLKLPYNCDDHIFIPSANTFNVFFWFRFIQTPVVSPFTARPFQLKRKFASKRRHDLLIGLIIWRQSFTVPNSLTCALDLTSVGHHVWSFNQKLWNWTGLDHRQ